MNSYLPKYPSVFVRIRQKFYGAIWFRDHWSSIACLICIGLLTPLLVACMGANHPLKVGSTAGIVSENLYLAEELKYSQSKDIRLIDYFTAEAWLRALRDHQVDVAAVLLGYDIILAQTNADLKRQYQLSPKAINKITKTIHIYDLTESQKLLEPSNLEPLQSVKITRQQLHQQPLNQFI